MILSTRVLGAPAVAQLTERASAAVLVIGRDTFTRGDLAAVRCFNYQAAQTLSRVLATFKVKDTADVFHRIPPSALAVPHIGAVALAVLGAAFEARGLGAGAPLERWVTLHDRDHPIVTFSTLKHRASTDAHSPATRSPRSPVIPFRRTGATAHGNQRPTTTRRTVGGARNHRGRAADRARAARR